MRYVLAVAFLLTVLACGIWDIIVVARGMEEDTVSRTLHHWSLIYPILPLAIGLIVGHIFWPQEAIRIMRDGPPKVAGRHGPMPGTSS